MAKKDTGLPRREADLAATAPKHTVTQGRTHQANGSQKEGQGRDVTAAQKTEAAREKTSQKAKTAERFVDRAEHWLEQPESSQGKRQRHGHSEENDSPEAPGGEEKEKTAEVDTDKGKKDVFPLQNRSLHVRFY